MLAGGMDPQLPAHTLISSVPFALTALYLWSYANLIPCKNALRISPGRWSQAFEYAWHCYQETHWDQQRPVEDAILTCKSSNAWVAFTGFPVFWRSCTGCAASVQFSTAFDNFQYRAEESACCWSNCILTRSPGLAHQLCVQPHVISGGA